MNLKEKELSMYLTKIKPYTLKRILGKEKNDTLLIKDGTETLT